VEKLMSYLCIDLLHFPDEKLAQAFEAECPKMQSEFAQLSGGGGQVIFVGRMARDPLGKYSHCIVYKFDNFESQKKINEDYGDTLAKSSNPLGDFAAYTFDHWYGFRVAELDDPIVKEHGIEEWTRREALAEAPPVFKHAEKVAQWRAALQEKFLKDWPREALVKSGWIPEW
jgi:hypothetical protein